MTNKLDEARAVLLRAQEEILNELVRCGSAGGTGKAMNYAPQLVNINTSIGIIDALIEEANEAEESGESFADRMAAARKAKKNQPEADSKAE